MSSLIEPLLIEVEGIPYAYAARLERLGAFSENDKRNAIYRRRMAVERARLVRDRERESRHLGHSAREHEATEKHRRTRRTRRLAAYNRRFRAIEQRVAAERKIRPAGKSVASVRRYREQMIEALGTDPAYRRLRGRQDRADGLLRRIDGRYRDLAFRANVLAIDTRAERRAKVARYLKAQSA
jgi:hypothetical protein